MKRRVMSAVFAFAIVFLTSTSVLATNVSQIIGNNNTVIFSDVPSGYWAQTAIEYFAKQGVVSGNGNGAFLPEEAVTREQFCKMLVLTFQAPLSTPKASSFSDMTADRWSFEYVEVCKNYMTEYANPFGGLPAFHPEEDASREDIAVALVRMMGLTDSDVKNKYYASNAFSDSGSISPKLLPYVSLACEKGLISGYPDGTFRPSKGITRAESVTLLNRATKQAVTDANKELELSANCVYGDSGKKASIYVDAEEGTAVTIDGNKVEMSSNGSKYKGVYSYTFTAEGSKTFTVTGTKLGKSRTIAVTAKYEVGTPVLSIAQCPASTTSKNITITGTASDPNYKVSLTINNENVWIGSNGSWEKSYTLKEGENKFVFVVTSSSGKTATEERTIVFSVGGPTITIAQCPTTVTSNVVTITGTASDPNYKVSLTINNENVWVGSNGSWEKSYTLKEGENKFVFIATSTAGKTATEERAVTFTVGSPSMVFINCPEVTQQKNITIQGRINDDYSGTKLFINDQAASVDHDGNFSKSVFLTEGDNSLTFRAVNTYGKSQTVLKTIKYVAQILAPTVTVDEIPASVNEASLTVTGSMSDTIDPNAKVYVNDKLVSSAPGKWSAALTLVEGKNNVIIVATNSYGKSATVTKTVTYSK